MTEPTSTVPSTAPWGTMESLNRMGRLARKELSEILRDRRTIITLVLMPLLLYPILSFAFRQLLPAMAMRAGDEARPLTIGVRLPNAKQEADRANNRPFRERTQKELLESLLVIAHRRELISASSAVLSSVPNGPSPLLARSTAFAGMVSLMQSREPMLNLPMSNAQGGRGKYPKGVVVLELADPTEAVKNNTVDVALEIFPIPDPNPRSFAADWVATYDDQSPRGRDLVHYLEKHIAVANAAKLQDDLSRLKVSVVPAAVRMFHNSGDTEEIAGPVLSLTAVIPLILILMTITGAVYPAIDLTAGERERGTLELLVSAPVPRMALLLGKYAAVVTVAMLTATINLAMMLVTLELNNLTGLVFKQQGVSWSLICQLFFLLMLFAAFFSAVLLALTSFARSFKEAQAYLIPLMLASLGPGIMGMIPGLRLSGVFTVTPLLNIVLLARDLSEGSATVGVTVVVVISTLIYALVAIAVAARIFGAEAVLYSETTGWSDLFRRPQEGANHPTLSGAMMCMAFTLPGLFLASSLLPHFQLHNRIPMQAVFSALLFIGLPLIGCYFARIRVLSALQIKFPPWASWLAALLLAFACVPLIYNLLVVMRGLGLTLLSAEQEQMVRALVRTWRRLPPGVVAGSFALVGAAEELFFRGYLFSALRANAGKRMTIIGSALLFGLFHGIQQFEQIVPSTVMGLLLGWICWHTRSVLPGMVLHAAYNGTFIWLAHQQTSFRSSDLVQDVPFWWEMAAIPAGLAGLGLVYWFRQPADPTPKQSRSALHPSAAAI